MINCVERENETASQNMKKKNAKKTSNGLQIETARSKKLKMEILNKNTRIEDKLNEGRIRTSAKSENVEKILEKQ